MVNSCTADASVKVSWRGWVIWAIATTFFVLQMIIQLSTGVLVKQFMRDFHLDATKVGLLISAYYYLYVVLQIPAGYLAGLFGTRKVLLFATLVTGVSCALFSISHSFWLAIFSRILLGGGLAFTFVGLSDLTTNWLGLNRFGLMLAISEGITFSGIMLFQLYCVHSIELLNWRVVMHDFAISAWILMVFIWMFVQNKPMVVGNVDVQKRLDGKSALCGFFKKLCSLLSNKGLLLNGIFCGVMFSVLTVFVAAWGPLFLSKAVMIDLPGAVKLLNFMMLGFVFGNPIMSLLNNTVYSRKNLLTVSAVLCAVFLWIVILRPNMPVIFLEVCLFFTGIFASCYLINFIMSNQISTDSERTLYVGFTNALCTGTAPVLQILVGSGLDQLAMMKGYYGGAYHIVDMKIVLSILPVSMLVCAWCIRYMSDEVYEADKWTVIARNVVTD